MGCKVVEPHFGWAYATFPSQDECEAENEHGGDVLDEPHDKDADEPSLGRTVGTDQRLTMKVDNTAWIEDGEQDAGEMPEECWRVDGI